jgi:hypothetical protein
VATGITVDGGGSAHRHFAAGRSTARRCLGPSKPITRGIPDARRHCHSDRCGRSDCRAYTVCNPYGHRHADQYGDSRGRASKGKHAVLESDAGVQCRAFDRPCLLWPHPIPWGLDSGPDGHSVRDSDLDRSGDDPISGRRKTFAGYATDSIANRNTDSDCLPDANGNTVVHVVTDADRDCVTHSYRNTNRCPFTPSLEAGRQSDYPTLKRSARALRIAVNKSCSLWTPTRLAASRGHGSGASRLASIGRLGRGERDARRRSSSIRHAHSGHTHRPIDRHCRDRPACARGSANRTDASGRAGPLPSAPGGLRAPAAPSASAT